MSNAEHYFQNLLYSYARSLSKPSLDAIINMPDDNKKYLTDEELKTIEMCFVNIVAFRKPRDVLAFLEHDYLGDEDDYQT